MADESAAFGSTDPALLGARWVDPRSIFRRSDRVDTIAHLWVEDAKDAWMVVPLNAAGLRLSDDAAPASCGDGVGTAVEPLLCGGQTPKGEVWNAILAPRPTAARPADRSAWAPRAAEHRLPRRRREGRRIDALLRCDARERALRRLELFCATRAAIGRN
jgi:hypothetical protein